MTQDDGKVIPFPARQVEAEGDSETGTGEDARMLFAASASAAASETVLDMMERNAQSADAPADQVGSMAVNVGILWGAILGIANSQGQVPAIFALEHLVEKLRRDPDRFLTKQQQEFAASEQSRSEMANVLGALMVESHAGPYVTNASD